MPKVVIKLLFPEFLYSEYAIIAINIIDKASIIYLGPEAINL